jgi:hypothetical protein
MLKKTLIAMAVAGALGASAGVFAGSATQHNASENLMSSSMSETHALVSSIDTSPIVEIGDGITVSAAHFDESFDGIELASIDGDSDDGGAVGSTAGADASGSVGFSSDGRAHTVSSLADEAYLVPAPLASFDGTNYWKVEVKPSAVAELDRLATENVYVMFPIEDAIVDPQVALTAGPDAFADLGTLVAEESSSS